MDGFAAGLWMTDPGATPLRLVLEVYLMSYIPALTHYHDLEARFTTHEFVSGMAAYAPLCSRSTCIYLAAKLEM